MDDHGAPFLGEALRNRTADAAAAPGDQGAAARQVEVHATTLGHDADTPHVMTVPSAGSAVIFLSPIRARSGQNRTHSNG
ncbi:hypothetical protein GCM10009619_18830 [Williamsia maris]